MTEPQRQLSDIATFPPATESLMYRQKEHWLFSREIWHDQEFHKNVDMRQRLYDCMDSLFRGIPRAIMEITEAVDKKIVDSEQVANLYTLLADFLEADAYHARIILYLPFELLCNPLWQPASACAAKAITRFNNVYVKKWHDLLCQDDLRANFVDGDILEPELSNGPLVRVRKAAHLIPQLIKKGFLSVTTVMAMRKNAQHAILEQSIDDALAVIVDASVVPQEHAWFSSSLESYDYLSSFDREGLERLFINATKKLREIQERYIGNKNTLIPKSRNEWEKAHRTNLLITAYAQRLGNALAHDLCTPRDIEFVFSSQYEHTLIAIRAMGRAVEILATDNMQKAVLLYKSCEPLLNEIWHTSDIVHTRDTLISLWSRLLHAGVLEESYLEQRGIRLPKLDALSWNENKFIIEKEISACAPVIAFLQSNPEISKLVYPVLLFFGSRIKGYAAHSADLDVAVFIKPDISLGERSHIQDLLRRILTGEKMRGKALEFWLTHDGGALRAKDFVNPDNALGDSTLAHVLFGGMWYGNTPSIKELHHKLLSGYLYSKGKTTLGRDSRTIWINEIERDALLYRLMHKGYAQYYAPQSGMNTPRADRIDGSAAFWDSGYRRIATKLFISRVFLPQLEQSK